jgi:dihydropteroate synthase
VLRGARIVRAHDVAATVDAVRIANVMHAASTVPAPVATMPRM